MCSALAGSAAGPYTAPVSTPEPLQPPPPDWEPGAVSVPVAAPRRRRPAAPAPDPAAEPEPDFGPPLAPGELAELVVDGGGVRPEDLPPAERAALEARRAAARGPEPAPDRATLQQRAQRILSERLGALESILSDTRADASDVTRAMAEVRAIAGARAEPPKQARDLAAVLADMASALREHGWTVTEPAPGETPGGSKRQAGVYGE